MNIQETVKTWASRMGPKGPDLKQLKAASIYPDLIGKKTEDVVLLGSPAPMYFLHCPCGMLTGTSKDYSGGEAFCRDCQKVASDRGTSPRRNSGHVAPRVERQILFGLIVFVFLGAIMLGMSVSNGGSRPESHMRVLD